jgi:putative phosphoesterase
MRVALIADIHANLPALCAVHADIRQRGISDLYCLGDLVGYYPWPNEVVDFVRLHDIPTIQGNYDQAVGEELLLCGCDFTNEEAARVGEISLQWTIDTMRCGNSRWLRELPENASLQIGPHRLLLVHGSPRQNNEYLTADYPAEQLLEQMAERDYDILLCAHTHLGYHRQLEQLHVINAGSAGKPKHGNPNVTYTILHLDEGQVRTELIEVAYDYQAAALATEQAGLPTAFADILRTGRA